MLARILTVGAAVTLVGGSPAVAADQLQPQNVQQANQRKQGAAPTVLAAVDTVRVPDPLKSDQAAVAPKRPRAARVTSCRCGEPNAN